MPELPEVETLKIQLSLFLVGLKIKKIEILKSKSFKGETKDIIGAKITGIKRFGKMLILDLDNNFSLAIHLKLTGQLIYRGERQPEKIEVTDPLLAALPNKHTRVIIYFENGDCLFFNDMRIFGWIKVVQSNKEVKDLSEKLGPEPLKDLTLDEFKKILQSTQRPIKITLMDQEKISGVGNIYANDALFISKINPKLKANKLSSDQALKLYNNLEKVLKDAIKWRGASEQHFRDALGQMGEVQKHFYVYQKDGQNCPNNCGAKIERIKLAGRGTFFCPKCQR